MEWCAVGSMNRPSGSAMAPLLRGSDLWKTYASRGMGRGQKTTAVGGVNIDLVAGKTLGLVGESGSGKTTLGRLLLRLTEPDRGSLAFEGVPFEKLGRRELRALRPKMQMIFQSPYGSLNPRLTVGKAVEFSLLALKVPKKDRQARAAEAIRLVGLAPEILSRYPHELSGGQAQRVGFARAMVGRPRLIVADEVVSALDASVQAEILALLLDLRAQFGLGALFISHDLRVVRQVSDNIAVMCRGRIVESAPTNALFEDARHPYTRLLLASRPGTGMHMTTTEREQQRVILKREHEESGSRGELVEVIPGHLVEERAGRAEDAEVKELALLREQIVGPLNPEGEGK